MGVSVGVSVSVSVGVSVGVGVSVSVGVGVTDLAGDEAYTDEQPSHSQEDEHSVTHTWKGKGGVSGGEGAEKKGMVSGAGARGGVSVVRGGRGKRRRAVRECVRVG